MLLLTFYATLMKLEQEDQLVKLDPDLPMGVLQYRSFYASQHLTYWIGETLVNVPRQYDEALEPIEQVDQLLQRFAEGKRLSYGREFKCLSPIGDCIWELKTKDVRIFGWFPIMDCFIGAAADDATRVKSLNMYAPYRDEAVRFRTRLGLPFLSGDDPHVVLSNKD